MTTFSFPGIKDPPPEPKTPLESGWLEREIAATARTTMPTGAGLSPEQLAHAQGKSPDYATGVAVGRAMLAEAEARPPAWLAVRAAIARSALEMAEEMKAARPDKPKRDYAALMGGIAGVALGIGLAVFVFMPWPAVPPPSPFESRAAWSTYDFGWYDLTDHMLKLAARERPPRRPCLFIGDAIAEGVAKLLPDCDNAAAPGTLPGGVGLIPAADVTVISLGSVEPTDAELPAKLAAVRERVQGRVVWIVPIHPRARATVLALAKLHDDATHTFTPVRGETFPANYPALAKAIQGSLAP